MDRIIRIITLVILTALLAANPLEGQKKQKDSRAQAAFDAGEYFEAIDLYKNAVNMVNR